jgi:hypothetical protein
MVVFTDTANATFVGGTIEEFAHFFVGCLSKIEIPRAHGVKGLWRASAHYFLDLSAELIAGIARPNGNRHDNCGGMALSQRSHCGAHACSGGQAVVNKDDGSTFKLGRRTIAPVDSLATSQFLLLLRNSGFDPGRRDAKMLNNLVIEHPNAAGGDCAHGELLVARSAKFADDKDVERRAESARDLETDRDAAPREGQHGHLRIVGVMS